MLYDFGFCFYVFFYAFMTVYCFLGIESLEAQLVSFELHPEIPA